MNIAVIGLGLIGGSLCKAIKARTAHTCLGLDTNQATLDAALSCGAIDRAISADGLKEADLVIIALHPRQTIQFALTHAADFRKGAIVTDVCGVKDEIVSALTTPLAERGVRFVGTHPMAGREFSGFAYALETLFDGASFIVTPIETTDSDATDEVCALAQNLGFGRVVRATPEEHDSVIAFTSQLAHVVSNAYVKSPTNQKEAGFSAGSYADLTRVAQLNEDMWTDLFLLNRDPLVFEIDELIDRLNEYRTALTQDDADTLRDLLRDGRERKQRSMGVQVKKLD